LGGDVNDHRELDSGGIFTTEMRGTARIKPFNHRGRQKQNLETQRNGGSGGDVFAADCADEH
jgi:hypothetical protein